MGVLGRANRGRVQYHYDGCQVLVLTHSFTGETRRRPLRMMPVRESVPQTAASILNDCTRDDLVAVRLAAEFEKEVLGPRKSPWTLEASEALEWVDGKGTRC